SRHCRQASAVFHAGAALVTIKLELHFDEDGKVDETDYRTEASLGLTEMLRIKLKSVLGL
ncbi:MAG TPA: hypothetical protein VG099_05940, partial [Gemmataceae bacterium]|nr:hypothetical protein [Gemmataceae bacterium]